jgi:hypothetical protein
LRSYLYWIHSCVSITNSDSAESTARSHVCNQFNAFGFHHKRIASVGWCAVGPNFFNFHWAPVCVLYGYDSVGIRCYLAFVES